ncbi:MAG: sel1 repeat family protein [Rhodospirillales bacterium]|jgi:uncharacterized protein|nr:sel1 repeat family protein [Rhodospirillales bacterium]
MKGYGIPQDYEIAVSWFKSAAEQGVANAQSMLGVMYYGGEGVPQNDELAFNWNSLAAEQGNATSQALLGMMYAGGRGTASVDYIRAYMWLELARTNDGISEQMYSLAKQGLDLITNEMTSEQIAEAQSLAREWQEKHQQ